jgi:hypothetical protein
MSVKVRVLLFFCVLLVCGLATGPSWGLSRKPPEPSLVPGKVLVKFHDGVTSQRIARIIELEGGTEKSVLASTGVHIIVLPEGMGVSNALARFSSYKEVKYAEPVHKATPLEKK